MGIGTRLPGRGHDDAQSEGAVSAVMASREADLGDFVVRRVLPHRRLRNVGPWVFFDHFGPVELEPGERLDVRPHPHIGLATATYLFDGEIQHRDSLGNQEAITPGAINLMVAGRGIVHPEREHPDARAERRTLHGLQLWLALPEADEEMAPAFHHYPVDVIPSVTLDGVAIRAMMGEAFGLKSPVQTFADTLYLEAAVQAGQQIQLPPAEERAVYVVAGRVTVGGEAVPEYSIAVPAPDIDVIVATEGDARIVLIGGERLGKRYVEWNFVSSRAARIEQAKADWAAGRFPKVPGDEDEFIPLPD